MRLIGSFVTFQITTYVELERSGAYLGYVFGNEIMSRSEHLGMWYIMADSPTNTSVPPAVDRTDAEAPKMDLCWPTHDSILPVGCLKGVSISTSFMRTQKGMKRHNPEFGTRLGHSKPVNCNGFLIIVVGNFPLGPILGNQMASMIEDGWLSSRCSIATQFRNLSDMYGVSATRET